MTTVLIIGQNCRLSSGGDLECFIIDDFMIEPPFYDQAASQVSMEFLHVINMIKG
jgi:hypothetical protein